MIKMWTGWLGWPGLGLARLARLAALPGRGLAPLGSCPAEESTGGRGDFAVQEMIRF